ncbi:hypothetical protein [Streptomyces luteireticuli]|uniref:hypothetical protein n=1 Tax=Streptomyces luteireticuli TaxID=173858 RepID=UPI003557C9BC
MEAGNLADAAVQWLTAVASGAGSGLGQGVADLVRRRMSQSPDGRAALNRIDANPADPAARAAARTVVVGLLDLDPAFRYELDRASTVLVAPSAGRDQTHIHVNGRVKGSISVGTAAVPATGAGNGWRIALVVLLLVVILVAGFVIYRAVGGRQGGGDSSSPSSPSAPARSAPGAVTASLDNDRVAAIVPDLRSMPAGWTSAKSPGTFENGCKADEPTCAGATGAAEAAYKPPGSEGEVSVGAVAYSSADAAAKAYARLIAEAASKGGMSELPVPAVGDQYTGMRVTQKLGTMVGIAVRVGNVISMLNYGGKTLPSPDVSVLNPVAVAVAERARQAQRGEQPSARVGG